MTKFIPACVGLHHSRTTVVIKLNYCAVFYKFQSLKLWELVKRSETENSSIIFEVMQLSSCICHSPNLDFLQKLQNLKSKHNLFDS